MLASCNMWQSGFVTVVLLILKHLCAFFCTVSNFRLKHTTVNYLKNVLFIGYYFAYLLTVRVMNIVVGVSFGFRKYYTMTLKQQKALDVKSWTGLWRVNANHLAIWSQKTKRECSLSAFNHFLATWWQHNKAINANTLLFYRVSVTTVLAKLDVSK